MDLFIEKGGIYFSIILKPTISPMHAPKTTLMAAVAVARTIKKLFDLKPKLKWPNDVLIDNKKVCGILAEMDAEIDRINFINLGIGINVNNNISKKEKMAISLKEALGKRVDRKMFFTILLEEIKKLYHFLESPDLLKEWKNLSVTLGKNVKIIELDKKIIGKAIDIDENGALIIETHDGTLKSIFAGDCVHLR